jgi:hypothetical protein
VISDKGGFYLSEIMIVALKFCYLVPLKVQLNSIGFCFGIEDFVSLHSSSEISIPDY